MSAGRKLRFAIGALLASHGLLLLAGFFAPYHYASQNRELPFAPPSRVHFVDASGKVSLRPFIYRWKQKVEDPTKYQEDQSRAFPIRFFVIGEPYKIFGNLVGTLHLFGVEEPARVLLLGSDAYGRDQLSRLLFGGRISLFAGILATTISVGLGLLLGSLSGFYGGLFDEVVMRVAEIFLALPWLYLLVIVRGFLPLEIQTDHVFLLLIAVMGLVGWARPARLIRGSVLSAREREFVLAAKGFGGSDLYVLRRHILPQAASLAFTQASVLIPRYVLAEVALSFFGLGVSEPAPSWGNMLGQLRQYQVLASYWWMFAPAVALVLICGTYFRFFSYFTSNAPSVLVSSPEALRHDVLFTDKF